MNGPASIAADRAGQGCSLPQLLAPVPAPDVTVSGLTLDSRQVSPGDLFLACRGVSGRHGLDFLEQAISRGAAAVAYEPDGRELPAPRATPLIAVPSLGGAAGVIADRYFGAPSSRLRVVGVTGTNGKTTVAWLLASIAERLGLPTAVMGTLGNGRPSALEAASLTTLDVVSVHRSLAQQLARAPDLDGAVMEVSSHALDQGRVGGVRFDAAIFTNLSRDHLDYHGDMEAYAAAKARLFSECAPRLAVLNVDDEVGRRFATDAAHDVQRLITFGRKAPPPGIGGQHQHLAIESLVTTRTGLSLALGGEWGGATLSLPILGHYNAYNAIAALAVLLDRGLEISRITDALGESTAPPGRMQQLGGGPGEPLVVIDYAHTPDSLRQALGALREYAAGELICVFGCGGDRDCGKRPLMAQAAQAVADRLVVTDDNPRAEDPARIVEDILRGFDGVARYVIEHDRRRAIRQAVMTARAEDVVLIAGKGHETYQLRGAERLGFSDYAEAAAALRELRS